MISRLPGVHLKKLYFTEIWEKHFIGGIAFHKNKSLVSLVETVVDGIGLMFIL